MDNPRIETGAGWRGEYRGRTGRCRRAGFTLIEILIVISIISILISIAIPTYRQSVIRARESVLKENLYVLRSTIEQFTLDKERAPASLEELVTEGYLRALPPDITGSSTTWQVEYSDFLISPEQGSTGISDVRSGSSQVSTEGTPYNTW
ncbi:MAG TPA: prepilin-type N-terminal cleavage/methylation domain-containing protein [Candidatus Acidoferrales bacterium]|nr:prepilin-type N-terminal cleavage/methylation domain-containing protein [Candidatus Acidoferrales bacterium]